MKAAYKLLLCFVFITSCTSNKPEDRVAQALDKAFGKEEMKIQLEQGLEKLLGNKETKFKTSVLDFFLKSIKISHSDIKVQDKKATAVITVERPSDDEFAGLFLIASFVDRKKLDEMTIHEFLGELSKNQRKTASVKDLKIETFKGPVELTSDGENWKVDEASVKNFFSKKNKVKVKK